MRLHASGKEERLCMPQAISCLASSHRAAGQAIRTLSTSTRSLRRPLNLHPPSGALRKLPGSAWQRRRRDTALPAAGRGAGDRRRAAGARPIRLRRRETEPAPARSDRGDRQRDRCRRAVAGRPHRPGDRRSQRRERLGAGPVRRRRGIRDLAAGARRFSRTRRARTPTRSATAARRPRARTPRPARL
jgi:hypothetical protein